MVRQKGLEPSRLAALEPKSSVSTNFTTGAKLGGDYNRALPRRLASLCTCSQSSGA